MFDNWIYMDEYDKLPAADFVHCDTRDFHIICRNKSENYEQIPELDRLIGAAEHGYQGCKFNRSEILGCLKAIEMVDGKHGWRMLHNKRVGWLKYIRFAKLSYDVQVGLDREPVYLAYTESGGRYYALSREELDADNFSKTKYIGD